MTACSAVGLVVLSFAYSPSVSAESMSTQFSNAQDMVIGQAVSINRDDPDLVEATSLENQEYFIGVIEAIDSSSIAVAGVDAEIVVTVSGEASVFVSDVSGEIKEGDTITTSSIGGVLQKRVSDDSVALAVALEDFNQADAARYESIEYSDGSKKDVHIHAINARLLDGAQLTAQGLAESNNTGLLSFIAGKDVSVARTIFAVVIFVSSLTASILYTYSSIRGSFISIGRNPLASSSILSGVAQVSLLSVVILTIGSAASYLILVV